MPQVPNNVKFGVPLFVVSFVVFAIALWGGARLIQPEAVKAPEGVPVEGGAPAGGPVSVTIVARNILFDKRSLTGNASAAFTVTLDNQDAGVLHNIAFYTNRSASQAVVSGSTGQAPFAGVASQTLSFTPPRVGTFYFRCDVHPDTMNGSFIVR